jgi:hypothetical protein
MVKPPTVSEQHPDRELECERALALGLETLADWADLVGWHEDEVYKALFRLVVARIVAADLHPHADERTRRAWLTVEAMIRTATDERL